MKIYRSLCGIAMSLALVACASAPSQPEQSVFEDGVLIIDRLPTEVEIEAGGATYRAPAPEGYLELTQSVPKAKKFFETITGSENRMLAGYASPAYLLSVNDNPNAPMKSYMMLQVHRQLEGMVFSKQDFDRELKPKVRAQGAALSPKMKKAMLSAQGEASEKLSELAGKNTTVTFDQPESMGILSEDEHHISLGTLVTVNADLGEGPGNFLMAGGVSFLRLKGQLIYAYVYKMVEQESDLTWVADMTKAWNEQLIAANPE